MKKFLGLVMMSMLIIFFSGCGGGGGSASSSSTGAGGVGAKGPFVLGSIVTAYKLDDNGSRRTTVVEVNTTTTDDLGSYSFSNLGWAGPTELVISGHYFNENNNSTIQTASLSAIVDLTSGQTITADINVFTDLAAQYIRTLMQGGTSFAEAQAQAKTAIVDLFDLNVSSGATLEDLDLTDGAHNAAANAKLLRISSALAANPGLLDDLKAGMRDGNMIDNNPGLSAFVQLGSAVCALDTSAIPGNLATYLDMNVSNLPDANATCLGASFGHVPVLDDISDQVKNEDDSAFDITLHATGVDGDTITYSAVSADTSKATVGVVGTTLTITPVHDANSDVIISVTASDGTLADVKIFTVTLNPVNDDPVATNGSSATNEDANVTSNVPVATDVDGIKMTFFPDNNFSAIGIDGNVSWRYRGLWDVNTTANAIQVALTNIFNGNSGISFIALRRTPVAGDMLSYREIDPLAPSDDSSRNVIK